MINFSPYNAISFQGGLKKNLKKGESALREYKNEFPYVGSFTLWRQRIQNIETKKHIALPKTRILIDMIETKIDKGRERASEFLDCDYETFLNIEKNYMRDEKVGNCGECADVMRDYLKKYFDNVRVFCLDMYKAKREHVFCVVGMDKNAKIGKPSTWGNKAVVVDAWRGFVASVPDAIREYEDLYGIKYSEKDGTCDIYEQIYFE